MGQQLFKVDFQSVNSNNTQLNSTDISFNNEQENIKFFFPIETDETTTSDTESLFIDKIRDHIFRLTRSNELEKLDTDINRIIIDEVFPPLKEYNNKVIEQIKICLETQYQLHTSLTNKLKQDDNENESVEDDIEQQSSTDKEQISSFTIQSLASILLILIKSAETNDSTIIQKIVTLTSQLCEKLPIGASSALSDNILLYQSLQPVRDFLYELLLRNDTNIATQVTKILLSLSIAQFSFKEILPLLARLIFDTETIYDVRRLFIQLNKLLTLTINFQEQQTNFKEITDKPIEFLKSIGVYPHAQLMQLHKKMFTGQFIASVILTHIDIHHQTHFNEQFNYNSFSFEFNPKTFQILFNIITQLNNIIKQNSNSVIVYMLNICLRLFNTHLKYLSSIKLNLHRDLLTNNETIRKILSESSQKNFDLSKFVNEEELTNWFEFFLNLSDGQNEISEEASKAFIYLLNLRMSSFTDKLSFMHRYIIENKHQILINQFITEFNKNETLLCWIGILHDENNNQLEKTTSWKILESFIEICFNSPEQIDKERIEQIEKILLLFQQLLVCQLIRPTGDDFIDQPIDVPSSVVIQYLTSLFRHCARTNESNLFNSALVGLCLMTKVNELFDFTTVEPIFAAILPLLSDYILQSLTKEDIISNHQNLIYWLIGKTSFVMICGSPLDSLEIKYAEKLKLTIFNGGYEKPISEISPYLSNLLNSNLSNYSQFKLTNSTEDSPSDKEFLMSVFNNTGKGAELITNMKMFIQETKYLLQQSIEEQANQLVSVVYAVYIKHFDRIDLAKAESFQMSPRHTHSQLLSIFEYANYARTILRTIKAEGGDYQQFYRQTKTNALFLLLSIGKSDSIPMITEETPTPAIELPPARPHRFERQISRWTKAKHVLKLLRHLMQACIRFKKLMRKKQVRQQRIDAETLLSRAIDQFIYKENHLELDELNKCLDRQYERAITRLITYRFFEKFIKNVIQLKSDARVLTMLTIFIPMLRKSTLEWSYLENILAANLYLGNEIRNCYYSIIQTILPCLLTSESNILMQNLFKYLNLNYTSADLLSLSHNQIPQKLFSLCDVSSLRTKFLAYNWFRLFTLKLCQNIQLDQIKGKFHTILEQQRYILCHSFIQNKLKSSQTNQTEDKEYPYDSLKDLSFGWFNYILSRDSSMEISSKFEKDLSINEYLVLLLRCFYFYKHLRSICGTVSYIERLIDIYHQSEFKVTRILSLKILRQLIPYLPNYTNDRSKDLMEKFFIEILHSIGESFSSQHLPVELVTELIYLYRTLMSHRSAWQSVAINYVLDSIQSNLNVKSLQSNNTLVASLCILGGYVDHVGLTSIIRVSNDQQMNDESRLAMVMEINADNSDPKSCSIQYINENKIESMRIDQLQAVVQVPPPDLLLLPSINASIDSILDAFGHFLQLTPTASESLMFLQLKRRSISALFHILKDQKMVEIFMDKPYASIIAHLSMSESLTTTNDLCYFNKEFLEQYSLRLDIYQRSKQRINDHEDTTIEFEQNHSNHRSLVAALSTPISKYNGWKPFASKTEIQMWKQGRIGNNNIKLVPFPITAAKPKVFENCGRNHQFKGRIILTEEVINGRFPTFIIENLQVTEGKWYFCVKLPAADVALIGWATKDFTPIFDSGIGIGNDDYSWSYDGSRGILFNKGAYRRQFNDIRWQKDDVCGCGIDIDGDNTNIKYWLNGKLLGTAFKHKETISQSSKKCNLFPHGRTTTFFPGVTLQYRSSPTNYCEMIFSPEDMQQCPLPDGYKPLILPTLVNTENSLVAYPYHAYFIGDNQKDYLYTSRTMPSISLLRDFVNENHLTTEFQIDDHGLILPEDSNGFPLTIEKDASSFTIAYDFQLSQPANEMQTITLVMTNNFSIQIPLKKSNQPTRVAIIGNINEQQIKVYWNNQSQTFQTPFSNETTNQLTLYHLPKIAARMKNIAIWNYALSEDHIHCLFTNGLFYVVADYQQLQEHRKRIKTFSFTEKQFSDKTLIPFDQTFNENIWQIKKKQADQNEAKFFSSEHPSTIELFGNKTYLVLEKPIEPWSEYIIILDLSINKWPIKNKQWSIVQLNEKSRIYVTHERKLCLKAGQTKKESDQTLNLNEYYRLWITVKETSCHIFINGKLQIDVNVEDNRLVAQLNRFYLFQEKESTNNTIKENTVRIRCQSITFLNRSTTINEQMKTPNSSLQSLVEPPLSIITPILIAMGHQSEWIQYVIEQYKTTKISTIDRILREQKQQMENNVLDNKKKRFLQILSTLSPTIDQQKLKDLISTHDQFDDVGQVILNYWNDLQQTESIDQQNERFHSLISEFDFKQWIHNSSTITSEGEGVAQVGDRSYPNSEYSSSSASSSSSSSSSEDEEPEDDDYSSSSSVIRNGQRATTDGDGLILYRLHDLDQEQYEKLTSLEHQQKATEYLQEEISSNQYIQYRINCEQRLTTIYARDTIMNMLKVWSNNSTNLFPLDKFGDSNFIVKLFRLMFYHYTYTEENIDYMSLLIISMLKIEIKQILEQNSENKASLLCALQENIVSQIVQFLFEPSLLNENGYDEKTMNQQGSLKFVWKVLNIFLQLIKDKSIVKQNQIDILIPLLFPTSMIHLIFKLFLSVETHQSKILILRLFSNLIQMNNSFKLSEHMEHFLFSLLRELSSNEVELKSVLLSVMDVVFLLTERDGESKDVQLPQNVHDLFITIDIINALTDQTKQTVVPEQFCTKSKTLLGEGMQFSRDDFSKSNRHFDRTADFQLIDLMNKSQKLKKSFGDFIRSLPTESVPDSAFYQNYPSLSSIPTDCVLIRAKVLYQFQLQITNVLSLVDCSLSPGESFLTDQIRKAKIFIFSFKKHQLLCQSMVATESGCNHGKLHVRFDILKAAASNENNENTMFHQAYQQLYDKAQNAFRKNNKQIWKAQYINMHSTDQGGPYRDSITQICSDICSTRLPLFILCPNGRTNSGSNQDCWIPNVFPPNKSIPEKLKKQYRFVGQLMGLAIRKKHYLNVKFPPLFWKELLCDPITIDDIQSIDSQSFTLIHDIEQQIKQAKSIDTNTSINYIFNSIFNELRFEVISSAQQNFELIPSGSQIPITAENFKEYSLHYRQYRLNEFHRQFDFIRQGLHSIVPSYYLSLFTESELEEAVCGKGHIDVELLKRNTNYRHGYNQNSPVIEHFWKVISEMFTEEQKKMLLVFTWGRSTLPVRDEDFTSKFTISKFRVEDGNVNQALPLSHTCSFTIDLPEYSTVEIMYDRLNYAITHCSTIDGDGNLNAATANHEDDSNDYDSDDYDE